MLFKRNNRKRAKGSVQTGNIKLDYSRATSYPSFVRGSGSAASGYTSRSDYEFRSIGYQAVPLFNPVKTGIRVVEFNRSVNADGGNGYFCLELYPDPTTGTSITLHDFRTTTGMSAWYALIINYDTGEVKIVDDLGAIIKSITVSPTILRDYEFYFYTHGCYLQVNVGQVAEKISSAYKPTGWKWFSSPTYVDTVLLNYDPSLDLETVANKPPSRKSSNSVIENHASLGKVLRIPHSHNDGVSFGTVAFGLNEDFTIEVEGIFSVPTYAWSVIIGRWNVGGADNTTNGWSIRADSNNDLHITLVDTDLITTAFVLGGKVNWDVPIKIRVERRSGVISGYINDVKSPNTINYAKALNDHPSCVPVRTWWSDPADSQLKRYSKVKITKSKLVL